ncbi:flagellar biosynthetic protein FliO [Rosenbergiella collisarenosi]|uniref:flagellar biosynthetic protein FliO n=1 Tax=Rosenbergiella collisarenosi TaxID=1544695 RepID=UPI001F4D5627|nr:flagellar biosynthetic protein FliO [Rosenbergiella collisarenosi]
MTTSTIAPLAEVSVSQMVLQSGGALLVVLLVLLAIKKLLKHLPHARALKGSRNLIITETVMIGPRERLMVVRVGEKQIVLGVTAQTIQFLCPLDSPVQKEPDRPAPSSSRFAQTLAQQCVRNLK